jgi:hypothetical protein
MSIFRTSTTPTSTRAQEGWETEPADDDGLNSDELAALAAAEERIRKGIAAFSDAGEALAMIRDRKLYRATHMSFDTYVMARWKIGTDYAAKLIAAAVICQEMTSNGLPAPAREIHARQLKRVEPAHRPQVWQAALDAAGGDPEAVTAEAIAEIAAPRRTAKGRMKAPAAIKLRGKGWNLVMERKRADIDPIAVLTEALAQLRDRAERKAA